MKTSELTGAALDWAVAKCEVGEDRIAINKDMFGRIWRGVWICYKHPSAEFEPLPAFSTDWAQGGPILERHISELIDCGESGWEACCDGTYGATGRTALEAVCLAYVASKLGDEVEIPEELQ